MTTVLPLERLGRPTRVISKLMYLIAVILFVALAAFHPDPGNHLLEWGLAAVAAGLLLEGVGPASPIIYRREG